MLSIGPGLWVRLRLRLRLGRLRLMPMLRLRPGLRLSRAHADSGPVRLTPILIHQDICKQWIADLVVDVESQIEVGAGGTKGRDTVTEQPSDGGLEPESV